MNLKNHLIQMAEYNQWMNEKIYAAAEKLEHEQLVENRGAFFSSIIGTLGHIAVADIFWLKRFAAAMPAHRELDSVREMELPQSLDAMIAPGLAELRIIRNTLDKTLCDFANSLTLEELSTSVPYKNMKGVESNKTLFSLLMHVVNHQTHHRGQTSTLFSQLGIDIGVTDLVAILPNVE